MDKPLVSMRLDTGAGRLSADNRRASVFDAPVLTALAGWYGGVSITSESTDRLGFGEFLAAGRGSARVLTLGVSFYSKDEAARRHYRRAWSGAFHDGMPARLTVDWDGLELSCDVVQDGEALVTDLNPYGVSVQVPLRAADPHLYSAWRESTLRPIGAGVGLEFPFFARDLGQGPVVTFGTAVSTDEWVWNDGNADSWPVFDVVADAPGGFAVGLGDRRVTYPWPTFPDIPVSVDMAGAVTVAGVDQSHLLGERGWASVAPQSMESPSFEFLQGGNGWATVRHRDTYI